MKKPRIPVHYVQDVDYILLEYIEKLRECRRHQHTDILRNAEILERFKALVVQSVELHNIIMEKRS